MFDALPHGCTVVSAAGNFAGSPATDLLQYLVDGKNPLEIAMGLATANALIEQPPTDAVDDREATTYLNLQKGVKVAMVGLFAPLVSRIRATGAELTIIEKNSARIEILSDAEKKDALKSCDVAIITATTLLNNTFEETINLLGTPRAVAIMGPSTPLMPAIFRDTPVTHLGGAIVADSVTGHADYLGRRRNTGPAALPALCESDFEPISKRSINWNALAGEESKSF